MVTPVVAYEKRIAQNPGYAMSEAGRFFDSDNAVQRALSRITSRLQQMEVSYALVGGLAVTKHGQLRTTDDVDLLVDEAALQRIHEELEGLGYVPPFAGSRHLRDTADGVKIEFLVAGQYPGDGKPKPVVFPEPAEASVEIEGVRVISLPKLIEIKLASAMTAAHRAQDFADVLSLIRVRELDDTFAQQLDPYVREKFLELWRAVRDADDPHEQG
jgi:hypothetical protein